MPFTNIDNFVKTINQLLKEKQDAGLRDFMGQFTPYVVAKLINHLGSGKKKVFSLLLPQVQAEVILFVSPVSAKKILDKLSDKAIRGFLRLMDEADTADVLGYVKEARAQEILGSLQKVKQEKIRRLFNFQKEATGGVMDLNYIVVKSSYSFKRVIDKIQKCIAREDKLPFIVATDDKSVVIGSIPYRSLLLNSGKKSVAKLVQPLNLISHRDRPEEVLAKVKSLKDEAVGVVDDDHSIIGIIHLKDLLKLIEKEATKGVYGFAGVSKEEEITDGIGSKVRHRYYWLIINLATAFLASMVVSLFQGTIEKMALLAVYMPMVAGEGGNAATQALAVVVRGLSAGNMTFAQAKKVVFKESVAGLTNGVIVGIVTAIVAIMLDAPPILGLILGIAMVFNLLVAGFFGASVPFILKRFNIDPAVASSVFVTTATDIFGFFAFLGLATLFI